MEENNKDFKVLHHTEHNYKYPIIDLNNNELPEIGFKGQYLGKGFYTSTDNNVISDYAKIKKGITRVQRIPKGAIILNAMVIPNNQIKEFFKKINYKSANNKNLLEIYKELGTYQKDKLNRFLLSLGIDVIKYASGTNFKGDYSGYNYLIINENIINNPRGRKDFSETEKTYDNYISEEKFLNIIPKNKIKQLDSKTRVKFVIQKRISSTFLEYDDYADERLMNDIIDYPENYNINLFIECVPTNLLKEYAIELINNGIIDLTDLPLEDEEFYNYLYDSNKIPKLTLQTSRNYLKNGN